MPLNREQRNAWETVVDLTRRFAPHETVFENQFRDAAVLAVADHLTEVEALLGKLDDFISMLQERGVVGGHEVWPLRQSIAKLLEGGT